MWCSLPYAVGSFVTKVLPFTCRDIARQPFTLVARRFTSIFADLFYARFLALYFLVRPTTAYNKGMTVLILQLYAIHSLHVVWPARAMQRMAITHALSSSQTLPCARTTLSRVRVDFQITKACRARLSQTIWSHSHGLVASDLSSLYRD